MLNQIGIFILIIAFILMIYSLFLAYWFTNKKQGYLLKAAVRGSLYAFLFVSIAFAILFYQFYVSDFSNAFVASHSNFALPLFYRLTAIWAGQEGSLLLWLWILFLLLIIAIKIYYFGDKSLWQSMIKIHYDWPIVGQYHNLFPYVLVIVLVNAVFFAFIVLVGSNPFYELQWVEAGGKVSTFAPRDGNGLNPLLQHPAMVIHPPIIYIGFVGFVIPFAFAIAALWSKNLGYNWIKTIRKWTITIWLFLTAGIILGGHWAYVELGWGGYWAWDPVENGSLLPWLTGTAFLHSVIIQEKRGMLKVWNVSLIVMTYLLVIVATLITRSGLISSVHSFAKSNVGPLFIIFFLALAILSIYLIVTRLPYLRTEHKLDSLVSKESSFLYNNLILLTMTFAILWGTIFPLVSEIFTSQKITVGPQFFNKINMPLGLLLLFFTGIGPMLAWRKTSARSLQKNLLWPFVAMILSFLLLLMFGVRDFFALAALSLSSFVLVGAFIEFFRGLRARLKHHREILPIAFVNMMRQNQRRYGGYIVHIGIVVLFIGFAGNAFNSNERLAFSLQESHIVNKYKIQVVDIQNGQNSNYIFTYVKVDIFKNDQKVAALKPEKRVYHSSKQPSSEVAIYSTLLEDVYLVFGGLSNKQKQSSEDKIDLHIWIKPLVSMVWLGGFIILFGIIVALLPGLRSPAMNNKLGYADQNLLINEPLSEYIDLRKSYYLEDLLEKQDSLLRNLKDLDLDWDMGKFDGQDYHRMRDEYKQILAQVLIEIDQIKQSVSLMSESEAKAYIRKELNAMGSQMTAINISKHENKSTQVVPVTNETGVSHNKKFCPSCGAKVLQQDNFCAFCGNKLSQE